MLITYHFCGLANPKPDRNWTLRLKSSPWIKPNPHPRNHAAGAPQTNMICQSRTPLLAHYISIRIEWTRQTTVFCLLDCLGKQKNIANYLGSLNLVSTWVVSAKTIVTLSVTKHSVPDSLLANIFIQHTAHIHRLSEASCKSAVWIDSQHRGQRKNISWYSS